MDKNVFNETTSFALYFVYEINLNNNRKKME